MKKIFLIQSMVSEANYSDPGKMVYIRARAEIGTRSSETKQWIYQTLESEGTDDIPKDSSDDLMVGIHRQEIAVVCGVLLELGFCQQEIDCALKNKTYTNPKATYDMLAGAAEKLGRPVIYKTDLTERDKAYIEENNPQEFIWILRECGTDLIPDSSPEFKQWLEIVLNTHREAKPFLFKEGVLREIDRAEALAWEVA
jgi:hypothetical protein